MKNRNRLKRIIVFIIIAILFGLGQSGARKQENAKTINSNKNTVEIIKNTETTQTIPETENLYENSTEENLSIDLTEVNTEEMGYYDIPKYVGESYVEINNNLPYFSDEEYSKKSYEYYSSPDHPGRPSRIPLPLLRARHLQLLLLRRRSPEHLRIQTPYQSQRPRHPPEPDGRPQRLHPLLRNHLRRTKRLRLLRREARLRRGHDHRLPCKKRHHDQ